MHDEIIVAARGNRRQESDMPNIQSRIENSKQTTNSKLGFLEKGKKKPIKLVTT